MNKWKYIIVPTILSMAVACNKAEMPEEERQEISVEAYVGDYTKTTGTDFKVGDHFGLYLFPAESESELPPFVADPFKDNLLCTKTESGVKMQKSYYPESGKLDFFAYYPYKEIVWPYEWFSHTVEADQSDPLRFESSDFMSAAVRDVLPGYEAVPLTFSHHMSMVTVRLKPSETIPLEKLKYARMVTASLIVDCKVNVMNGKMTQGYKKASVTPFGNEVSLEGESVTPMSFVSVPQAIPAGTELFRFTTGNMVSGTQEYPYVTDQEIEWKAGYHYTFEITLHAAGSQVSAKINAMPR